MPRKKEYIEEEVIEKAMHTFWKNGYEATSTRMLEKEMGINQFSIYSSFQNKQGVFLESIKRYKEKLRKQALNELINSQGGIDSIKKYFYDFLNFTKENDCYKGCFLTNTMNEFGSKADSNVVSEINQFSNTIVSAIARILTGTNKSNKERVEQQANYLFVALLGLSVASKMSDKKQLNDFIEMTFKNL